MDKGNKKSILGIAILSIFLVIFLVIAFVIVPMNRSVEVSINTIPSGADYKIGKLGGKTPAETKLRPGNYKISFSLNGYETLDASFKVGATNKTVPLSYTLTRSPHQPSQKALEQNFGSGKPDPNWQSKQEAVNKKYSFLYKLPFRDGANYFYISKPTYDDKFFVYVPAANAEEGKRRALEWFDTNGVSDPAKNLNIIWQYR